jgi:hypothetical protein
MIRKLISKAVSNQIVCSACNLDEKLEVLLIELGRSRDSKYTRDDIFRILNNIQLAEFKVFSQWGDDGIISFLVSYLDISNKVFVEFGVESYKECNTRYLLQRHNWRGFVMDGSQANVDSIKRDPICWKYDLTTMQCFVTSENINQVLLDNDITGDIGLLHIDIDGNDYWVWKAIECVNPVIVVVEYNSVFGSTPAWSVPYDPAFVRTQRHYSNLYYGASLQALEILAFEKGYRLIGSNSAGNNAYFVRQDRLKNLTVQTALECFVDSKFAESRNEKGQLTFLRGDERIEKIRGMPVVNVISNSIEYI